MVGVCFDVFVVWMWSVDRPKDLFFFFFLVFSYFDLSWGWKFSDLTVKVVHIEQNQRAEERSKHSKWRQDSITLILRVISRLGTTVQTHFFLPLHVEKLLIFVYCCRRLPTWLCRIFLSCCVALHSLRICQVLCDVLFQFSHKTREVVLKLVLFPSNSI